MNNKLSSAYFLVDETTSINDTWNEGCNHSQCNITENNETRSTNDTWNEEMNVTQSNVAERNETTGMEKYFSRAIYIYYI